MKSNCDVLVIGTGTSAYQVAYRCANAGLDVATVDERAYGGTCARRGCQPKKFLVAAAEIVALSRQMTGRGITQATSLDWNDLMASKRAFTEAVPERTERGFREAGITTLHGRARFTGPDRVVVTGRDSGGIKAGSIVIATGARPATLDIPGAELMTTSEEFLELKVLPRRMVCVGGGFISLEFAHVVARAGVEVTILHRGERILPHFDPDLVDRLTLATREQGIDVQTGAAVASISGEEGDLTATTADGRNWPADLVLHGAGRVPSLENLDLDMAGVEAGPKGVTVDKGQRSPTNPAVFAIGDAAAGTPSLAPAADLEGQVAAANIIAGKTVQTANYEDEPRVVFAIPPLASVGMNADAAEAGRSIIINQGESTAWPTSRRIGQRHGYFKVILDAVDRRILGAQILGHGAGDLINIFALAIRQEMDADSLSRVLWAYPTVTSDVKNMLKND